MKKIIQITAKKLVQIKFKKKHPNNNSISIKIHAKIIQIMHKKKKKKTIKPVQDEINSNLQDNKKNL